MPQKSSSRLRVASCQFPVTADVERNGRYIRRYMRRAADAGAQLLHTSEACLSGYAGVDFESMATYDWQRLRGETRDLRKLAQQLGRDASVVAKLVEEIQHRLPKLAQPPDLANVEVARFRLFDALTQFVTRMSQSCPVVVASGPT